MTSGLEADTGPGLGVGDRDAEVGVGDGPGEQPGDTLGEDAPAVADPAAALELDATSEAGPFPGAAAIAPEPTPPPETAPGSESLARPGRSPAPPASQDTEGANRTTARARIETSSRARASLDDTKALTRGGKPGRRAGLAGLSLSGCFIG